VSLGCPGTPEQAAEAAAQRAKAHEAAKKKKWKDCNDAYAAADEVDPRGETAEQKVESNKCALQYFNSQNAKP
jgi:hypothetical protein